eukprot:superscaffoldBa00003149_g16240
MNFSVKFIDIICSASAPSLCSPVLTGEWTATVPENLDALVTSCVVIPCSFTQAKERLPHSRLRGIWHRPASRDDCIYHEDKTRIVENFRGRTELLGNLGDGNCTLLMTEIKDHDDGPFCFRIELVPTGTQTSKIDKFSFVEDCVRFKMISKENYNHIIIPAVVGIGTAVIFGGLCIFMMKKYKNRIAELQSQEGR